MRFNIFLRYVFSIVEHFTKNQNVLIVSFKSFITYTFVHCIVLF